LTEIKENGSAFEENKFLSKDGKPKELFLSSDANAVVEHTKKVLVIEDGEVVHLKVDTVTSLFDKVTLTLTNTSIRMMYFLLSLFS